MKKMNHILLCLVLLFVVVICLVNLYLSQLTFDQEGREYRVSVNRIEKALEEFEAEKDKAPQDLDELAAFSGVKEYPAVTAIYAMSKEENNLEALSHFLTEENEDYMIVDTVDYFYRITYETNSSGKTQMYVVVNGIAVLLFACALVFWFYTRNKILLPFYRLSEVPYELSKGNLTIPVQENKDKMFGRFVWGMDLLREHLEENKARELELQKEKKLLLLSLSHDIKTPLSAIKLYAKALKRNLYQDEEKKHEIAGHIDEKVDEIEGYISEIVRASNEDFLHFDVQKEEFYIKDVLEQIREYYADKMKLNQIAFEIPEYRNCLVYGDDDRLVEVLQNIIENAIKYGDGKRIWMETVREEEEYIIRISNTGCQLEEKELPHIFDSFFRGSNVEKKPGSGLGLYICRQLMHLMEGEVTAAVSNYGKDSVITLQVAVRLA